MGKYFSDVVEQAVADIYYCYDNTRAKAAEAALTLAAEQGDGDACYFLSRCFSGKEYHWEYHPFQENDRKAYELLCKGVRLGSDVAVLGALRRNMLILALREEMPFSSLEEAWRSVYWKAANGCLFCQRKAALALSFLLLFGSLAGCGGKEDAAGADGPANTYTPPVNDDGYIVVTMPITLSGGNTAEELEAQHQELIAGMSQEEIAKLYWTNIIANEDGSFQYIFTPEQFQRIKETSYMSGKLIDAATNTFPAEFIKAAEYADIDKNGIPWALAVSVDKKQYESSELINSFYVTVSPSIYMGMYQIFCGVPGDEWAAHVTVKDADSGEVLSEHDFPDRDE